MNDLTTSLIARKNVLNNQYALQEVENRLQLNGLKFENEVVFTKSQVAAILDITERTVDNYIVAHGDELGQNGYRVIRGKALQALKLAYVGETDFVEIPSKAPALGIFSDVDVGWAMPTKRVLIWWAKIWWAKPTLRNFYVFKWVLPIPQNKST